MHWLYLITSQNTFKNRQGSQRRTHSISKSSQRCVNFWLPVVEVNCSPYTPSKMNALVIPQPALESWDRTHKANIRSRLHCELPSHKRGQGEWWRHVTSNNLSSLLSPPLPRLRKQHIVLHKTTWVHICAVYLCEILSHAIHSWHEFQCGRHKSCMATQSTDLSHLWNSMDAWVGTLLRRHSLCSSSLSSLS